MGIGPKNHRFSHFYLLLYMPPQKPHVHGDRTARARMQNRSFQHSIQRVLCWKLLRFLALKITHTSEWSSSCPRQEATQCAFSLHDPILPWLFDANFWRLIRYFSGCIPAHEAAKFPDSLPYQDLLISIVTLFSVPLILYRMFKSAVKGAARCGYLSGRVRLFFRAAAVFEAAYTTLSSTLLMNSSSDIFGLVFWFGSGKVQKQN